MSDIRPLDRAALDAHPLPPVVGGDKHSKGRILILAGSRDVPGAALLAARAAMRAGAGTLKVATVESVAAPLGIAMPEAMVIGLTEHRDGGFAGSAVDDIAALAKESDAVVAGMGVEEGDVCKRIADALLESPARLALDAALLRALEPLDPPDKARPTLPVLLPHAGEMAAMLDCTPEEVERDPVGNGREAAQLYRAIVLVKGVTSHVVTPEGKVWRYADGAAGLGVSGSGDVLAGIAGGLLARGTDPLSALLWAVWLHGEAGRALSKKIGPLGFLAREIADEVPALLPR
ncbi:NAD(P)H-hydrate dehydratase [Sphingomonas lutea]|uniref:ADP-dependent (S)-NAD(P)H-hydrate dehydratase n=1 Tax=Sphingomonas lutea TaxID=1045317 RepID=A0A7G9SJX4_9SPHN|nr:NAD(P)H-hydrate dehydratase [Sphingomonas lutea]QNN68149.1 NAD(P)H-hydrate dehydratase [Sphingomonas lutea]